MNRALGAAAIVQSAAARAPARVALLGTGTVGTAVLARLASWEGSPLGERLHPVHVANSRTGCFPFPSGHDAGGNEAWHRHLPRNFTRRALPAGEGLKVATAALGHHGTRILIDATASDDVAAHHADWLAQGIHVVTACKLGQGTSLSRWHAIQSASARSGARYGDAATVGAGLPLLRSIRALRDGGDQVHALAGVLSGSLGWLFSNYDTTRPFSTLVQEAREAGYTEPDPRDDLSGADVQRKLLILARAAGYALDAEQTEVESLVPTELAALPRDAAIGALAPLDAPLRERYRLAQRDGRCLRFVARFENGRARVGLEALAADDPLAQGGGCDSRLVIHSDRYRERPLVIQGPGAGAEVTAAALLDDVVEIVVRSGAGN